MEYDNKKNKTKTKKKIRSIIQKAINNKKIKVGIKPTIQTSLIF